MGKVVRLPQRSERYAAAKTGRSHNGWHPVDLSVNDLISMAGPEVRARVRQLIRDFPYFKRAHTVLSDYIVGEGIALQSRALGPDNKYSPAISKKIEEGFRRWADEADIAGRLHLNDIVRLAKDQDTECGEFIIIKTRSKRPGRYLPLALQMYEPDWLTSFGATRSGANRIEQGIEYDETTGEVIAHHYSDPKGYLKPQRIEAERIIHGFKTLRPGQLRGISDFVAGVLVTRDLQECMEGEVDGFKFASKWLAFIRQLNPGLSAANDDDTDEAGRRIQDLQNGIIEYLQPGEDVTLASNPRPTPQLTPFVRLILTMIAVATGVPYELLSGDYQGLSWAVVKVIRADFKFSLAPLQARHIRQCCTPIFHTFLDEAVLHGKLNLPGYWADPWRYRRAMWQPPVSDAADRLRDAKADIDEKNNLLRSPQEIAASRGRQYEDVLDEIVEAEKLAADRKLSPKETSTALANNPAAINKE